MGKGRVVNEIRAKGNIVRLPSLLERLWLLFSVEIGNLFTVLSREARGVASFFKKSLRTLKIRCLEITKLIQKFYLGIKKGAFETRKNRPYLKSLVAQGMKTKRTSCDKRTITANQISCDIHSPWRIENTGTFQ